MKDKPTPKQKRALITYQAYIIGLRWLLGKMGSSVRVYVFGIFFSFFWVSFFSCRQRVSFPLVFSISYSRYPRLGLPAYYLLQILPFGLGP